MKTAPIIIQQRQNSKNMFKDHACQIIQNLFAQKVNVIGTSSVKEVLQSTITKNTLIYMNIHVANAIKDSIIIHSITHT